MPAEADPEECPNPDDPEYVALWGKYRFMSKANGRREAMLKAQYGPALGLNEDDMTRMRIVMFINKLLPVNTVERIKFEIEWAELIQRSLESMASHAANAVAEREAEARRKALQVPPGTRF